MRRFYEEETNTHKKHQEDIVERNGGRKRIKINGDGKWRLKKKIEKKKRYIKRDTDKRRE